MTAGVDPIRGVYCITNTVSGKVYVGFGLDVLTRMTSHVRSLGLGRHYCQPMQKDWDTHGADAFTLELVEEAPDDLDAQVAIEERWIALAMALPPGAYNRHRSCKSRAGVVRRWERWRERCRVSALEHLAAELEAEQRPKRRHPRPTPPGSEPSVLIGDE